MSSINFVALDFETATSNRASACEVGLTFVEDGQIVKSESWFIKPDENRFDAVNTSIHGITPEMTSTAPSFAEQWGKLSEYLKGKTVVAHYAPFDMGVIRDECERCNLQYPEFRFLCSCALSRFVVPGMYSYGLEPICHHFGIDTENHHRGEVDTIMTAKLVLALCKEAQVDSIEELLEKYRYRFGNFDGVSYKPFQRIPDYSKKANLDQFAKEYIANVNDFDDENEFYDKEVVFTGTMYRPRQDMMRMVMDIGGRTKDSVTKTTDYLVVGQQDFRIVGEDGMSSKQKKAMQMIEKGASLIILSESEFLEMLGDHAMPIRPKRKQIDPAMLTEEESAILYRYWIFGDESVLDTPIYKSMIERGLV